jgi:hypothetical protein
MIDAAVIIPTTGNRPALLRRALASVHAQSPEPREILVIVDGPEAQVFDVHAQSAGLGASVLALGSHRGAGAARNHGARHARARYLCFLDDDDVWKPGYLAAVFADGPTFDLALTAFEKHTQAGARPEKVPPEVLSAEAFLVANPGLRGSNIVLTHELFWAAGGFSERLPSFNDMDFGLRLVAARPERYRRIAIPLVEYHAHEGERLSRRGARAIPPGLAGFLQEHGPKMDHRQEAAFRARAIDLWGIDPWALATLERRFEESLETGMMAAHFPGLLHAAETALLEATCRNDVEVDAYQVFIDRLCHAFERDGGTSRLRMLRIVVITTDTPGSVAALLGSLARALEQSRWRCQFEGPLIELLFVRNDSDAEIEEEHGAVLQSWMNRRIAAGEVAVPARLRPLSLAEARAFAFGAARDRGWQPTPEQPVWFLDEDFRFEILAPSIEHWFRRIPGGSLLHRIEHLALHPGSQGIDALVGGNSGAAPVPALGTIQRQLIDLVSMNERAREDREQALSTMLRRPDAYYDLTRDPGEELCMPVATAWWRSPGEWSWEDVVDRLMSGLPVTRPALPFIGATPASAWGHLEPAMIAGGNTVVLSARVLRPDRFAQVKWKDIRSRRGDTVWCIRCQQDGARIVRASFPLLHERVTRMSAPVYDRTIRDTLADALGVGLYETIAAVGRLDRASIEQRANRRLAALVENLSAAMTLLRSVVDVPVPMAPWIALHEFLRDLCKSLEAMRFHGIELAGE